MGQQDAQEVVQEESGGADLAPPATPHPPEATPAALAEPLTLPSWLDNITAGAFVDAMATANLNLPLTQSGANRFRAYDPNNGFGLAWAGLNLTYAADPLGGTLELRAGPEATIYAGVDAEIGLEFLKQAFATLKPTSEISFDLGKFDQPFGAEVADSYANYNYTRGLLYWLGQPLFFTGLRGQYAPIPELSLLLVAVNGWNSTLDNNSGKTFGLQITYAPIETAKIRLGYAAGPEQADVDDSGDAPVSVPGANSRLKHLGDLIVTFDPSAELGFVANASYGAEEITGAGGDRWVRWFGAMIAGRYVISPAFAASLRGELYLDRDGYTTGIGSKVQLESVTLTLEGNVSSRLVARLEGRLDHASEEVFATGSGATSIQPTISLGVVAKTF